MPRIRPGLLTEPPPSEFALGSSSRTSLQKAFPRTPYINNYADQQVRELYVNPPEASGTGRDITLNDGGYAFGEIPRYYKDAPNLENVAVGGGGLPGSPYGPNIAAPAEGHNPTSIPDIGVAATNEVRSRSTGAFLGNGLESPSRTSTAVTERTLRVLRVLLSGG